MDKTQKPTHMNLLACAVMSVALGCTTLAVQAQDAPANIDRSTQTSGPTGTPETTGDGGSADTTGAIRDQEVDGGMAGMNNAEGTVDAEEFLEEASAKGVAEIETARLALEQATSEKVKEFANMMIKDHAAANEKMAELAASKNLEISDEATLMDKAKAMILDARDGESFDAAYANNQVVAHEQTIELFERAARSEDAEIAAFAKKTLPKLKEHLKGAQALVEATPED
ncbi:outer membrane protein [Pseudomonas saudimassiliensis]|uniref:Outer membrane protein n=2 Tax=Pseudomonas saudimassiliensis TaxID=1461581 RepID=A0A078M9P2_9PSED|nr:outer membrane protein [Pseudomonas saudimassiliensis]CEF25737.1 outer membrane protein [Pseudomonas saudimassiliensis]